MAEYSTLGLRKLPYTLVLNPVEGGFAPTPMGRTGTGFPIGPIGTGRAAATAQVGETVDRGHNFDESVDRTPSPSSSSLGKYIDSIKDAIATKVEQTLGVPTALDPLTGTVRASGPPGILTMMMPSSMSALASLGAKMSKANMMNLAGMSVAGAPGYSTALVGNSVIGVQPTDTTIGGRVLEALGFNIEGYTLSGNIGSFTNVDQEAYEEALVSTLLANKPTLRSPIEALNLGFDPGQPVYRQTEVIQDLASSLGIDPFSPSSKYAFGGPYVPFVEAGGDRPDPTRPGGIVGTYDQDGNWRGVTSGTYTSVYGLPGMTDFAFYNMGTDYSARDMMNLEGTGGTDFFGIDPTGTGGAFVGEPVGMDDEYDNDPGGHTSSGSYGSYSDLGGSPHDNTGGDGGGGFGGGFGGSSSGGGDYGGGQEARGVAQGGRIEYAPGGNVTNGFVNKDPDSVTERESIADNRFTSVKEGSFIVNQPTNEKYEGMLDSLVAKAQKKVKKPKDAPMVDVALSDGERHIEPEVVAEIEKIKGKSFLDNLNDKGKPEVKRRQAKYGGGVGLNEGGIAEVDRGLVPQLVGPDRPKISGAPTSQGLGFIDQPPPSIDDDMYFGRRFGDIKSAIQTVEIKGFEDNPYIFTGIKRKNKASSAFGPMQITASTLKDIKQRSKFYSMLGPDEKQYMDLLIQQGDDKVNIEKYRSIYRDGKKVNTPKDIRKLYGRYGVGQIDPNLHEQYYDTIANITLMQKLQDHKTLKDALASYGEGTNYATKVLSALK